MHAIDQQGVGQAIGQIEIAPSAEGATFTGTLTGLKSGEHGFHVHTNGACEPGPNDAGEIVAGGAAGKHWDPDATGMHRGPTGDGHLGDLPALAGPDGTAHIAVTAPRGAGGSAGEGFPRPGHGDGVAAPALYAVAPVIV